MYIGLPLSASRSLKNLWRINTTRTVRSLSITSCQLNNWRNETPPGGLTEILVYRPESQILWPDATLGVFAQADPSFVLPGNVGVTTTGKKDNSSSQAIEIIMRPKIDILEENTSREHQAKTLSSAYDYIHDDTSGAETYVCSNPVLIETFPSAFSNMEGCKFELHDAPKLLKKELGSLFPDASAFNNVGSSISVITMARETNNDMSCWSDEVEEEREALCKQFVNLGKEVCCRYVIMSFW